MSGKGALLASRSVFREPASWTVNFTCVLFYCSLSVEQNILSGPGLVFSSSWVNQAALLTVHFPPLCQKRELSSNILSDYQVMLLEMKPKRVEGPMCLDP